MSVKRYGATKVVTATPTITAGAYSLGDAVGGKLTFTGLFNAAYCGGVLTNVTISDKSQQMVALNLWLFNQDFTATADNALFDPSDADLLNCIGVVKVAVADYTDAVDNSIADVSFTRVIHAYGTGGAIYGQLQVPKGGAAPTYVSTGDLQVRLAVLLDQW